MKTLFLLFTFQVCSLLLFAQSKNQDFELYYPNIKVANSQFNKISLIDLRSDTTNLGFRLKNVGTKKILIIPAIPLETQLQKLFLNSTDTSAKGGHLIFLITQLYFSESSGTGYFKLRANLLAKEGDSYFPLTSIDTAFASDAMDLTKVLLFNSSQIITNFVINNLQKLPNNTQALALYNIRSMDSVQKMKLPLYKNSSYINGAYKTYNSFKNQIPDDTAINIEFYKRTGSWKSIQLRNKKDKYEEVELKKWYSFSFNDKLFISTSTGVYPLLKKNNDFVFVGEVQKKVSEGAAFATGLAFGLVGGGILYSLHRKKGELVIDYLTGKIIVVQ
jgi:hypothetical protein